MEQYSTIEEYQQSYEFLDAELIQLENGPFLGKLKRQTTSSCIIEKRSSKAEHIHLSKAQDNSISLIFPNNQSSCGIQINGLDMGDKNQILDFGGETLNAIVPANFDVSAVVLDKAKIEEHLDLLLGNPNDIRKLTVNNIDQCVIANKVNYAYEQLANESFLNNAVSNLDLETSIYSLLVTYIDSNLIRQDKPKLAIKSKERKRVLDLLFSLPIKKLNVSNLASESYLSVRKLHYLCISSWGRTPNQMIINARYRKINTFLENGDFQNKPFIGRILQGCGITNISRFNRHYASIFGETPLKTLKK